MSKGELVGSWTPADSNVRYADYTLLPPEPGTKKHGRLVVSSEEAVVHGFDEKGDRFACTRTRWEEWDGQDFPVPSEFWLRRRHSRG